MPGKLLTEEGLRKDLSYLLKGIDCHEVLSTICPPRDDLSILEPGCGSGKLGLWYAIRECTVTLLDIDQQALDYAQALYHRAEAEGSWFRRAPTFLRASIHKIPFLDGQFDFVFNEGVPHHWGYNPRDLRRQRAINEMVRVTTKGGYVAVIGSNALCPDTVTMAESTSHTYPGMPAKQKPFTPDELRSRLIRAGLSNIHVQPVGSTFADSRLLVGWGKKA